MKTKFYITSTLLVAMTFLFLASCSKDKDLDDGPESGKGGITMKVDGDQWKATTTTLVTKGNGSSEADDYHLVLISGIRGNNNGLAESLSLYINIPANKFKNPKGTYSVAIDEEETDHSWAVLTRGAGTDALTIYLSGHMESSERTIGSLEITGFEIGDQRIPGQTENEEGYTKLSGNFHFEMYPTVGGADSDKLKITEGKFNLSAGFGFDL